MPTPPDATATVAEPRSIVGRLLIRAQAQRRASGQGPDDARSGTPSPSDTQTGTQADATQARALQRLKDELPELRRQAEPLLRGTSTSPTVIGLVKAMKDLLAEIEAHTKARDVVAAESRLDALTSHVNAIVKQLAKDQQAFEQAQAQLEQALAQRTSPVVAQEAQKIRDGALLPARQKADAGDAHGALVLALSGLKVCGTVDQLLKDFEQALLQAKNTVRTMLGDMFPLDTQRIATDFIDAARLKAAAGQRQAALDLLAKVPAECAQAKLTRDRSPFGARHTTELANDMETLLRHPQRAGLKAEIDALNQRYTRAKANQSQALPRATAALFSELYWECKRLTALVDQRGQYAQQRDTVTQPAVQALRAQGDAATLKALEPEIRLVEHQLSLAERQADKHLYDLATTSLKDVQQACAKVTQLKQDHGRYAALRLEVATLLKGLPDLGGTSLEAAVQRLQAGLAQATEQAVDRRGFAQAAQALEALRAEAQVAVQWATAQGQAQQAARQAVPAGADAPALAAGQAQVKALLDQLKAHAGQAGAAPQIDEIDRLLKQAAKEKPAEGLALLAKAADRYVVGQQHAAQHARAEQRLADIVALSRSSFDLKQPLVASLAQKIADQLAEARRLSLAQDHAQAGQRLDGALQLVAQVQRLVGDAERAASRLATLKAAVATALSSHTPPERDPLIGPDIQRLNQALAQIDKQLQSRQFEAALKALDQAEADARKAALKKKMQDGSLNASEMTDRCKQLAAVPNGQAALDLLVADLKQGQSVDGVMAAMKARFKLDDAQCLRGAGDDEGKVTQELCALYTTMTKVPETHTRDNASFKKIVRSAAPGSSYNPSEKAIRMGEGHPDASAEYQMAQPTQLPDVEQDCQPDPRAAPVKFFDWNTWHEVGHAMDDRHQFMSRRSGDAAYGGWLKHGGDVLTVAEAVATELATPGITAEAVARYLDAGVAPAPVPAGWNRVTAWAQAASHVRDPWDAGALCGASVRSGGLQAGGRIYHEAYQGDWYSYLPAARKQGITGYQFRAPGEWFSELYAAYKSGKLKPSHPARAWLQELFAD